MSIADLTPRTLAAYAALLQDTYPGQSIPVMLLASGGEWKFIADYGGSAPSGWRHARGMVPLDATRPQLRQLAEAMIRRVAPSETDLDRPDRFDAY